MADKPGKWDGLRLILIDLHHELHRQGCTEIPRLSFKNVNDWLAAVELFPPESALGRRVLAGFDFRYEPNRAD